MGEGRGPPPQAVGRVRVTGTAIYPTRAAVSAGAAVVSEAVDKVGYKMPKGGAR